MADNITAYFRNHPKLNKGASQKENRPIFDDRVVVELRSPGDTNRVVVHLADEIVVGSAKTDEYGRQTFLTYKEAYPTQWSQYEQNHAQTQHGTPLSELPFLTEAKRKSFRAVGVLTAEQLASLDGQPLKNLGADGREFKNKAIAYLESAEGLAKNSALELQIAELQAQLKVQQEAIEAMAKAPQAEPPLGMAGTVPDDRKPQETATETKSPFFDYEADDIKLWLADAAPDMTIDGRWGKEKLVAVADEVNNKLKGNKKVA